VIKLGVEVLLANGGGLLAGSRIGLVSNYTMTDSRLTPVIDLFLDNPKCQLVKLYGPEHGVRNSAKEGESISFATDQHSGLPAYSLYGDEKKPTAEMLSGIDVLVIDLQDIGTRYYTNMNTVALCIESCSAVSLPCAVLDRPNPIGAQREGYMLDESFASFVGMPGIPHRHGLTMGELARFHHRKLADPSELIVIPVEGWSRSLDLRDSGLPFVQSSPNTSGLDMMVLYPGTCLFEGTNVSVARGTTRPFEMIGAPWLDGHKLARRFNDLRVPGVVARPVYFSPHYSLYAGELCGGVQVHVTDAEQVHALRTGILLLQEVAKLCPKDFEFIHSLTAAHPFFDLLAGDSRLRGDIVAEMATRYLDREAEDLAQFSMSVKDIELY